MGGLHVYLDNRFRRCHAIIAIIPLKHRFRSINDVDFRKLRTFMRICRKLIEIWGLQLGGFFTLKFMAFPQSIHFLVSTCLYLLILTIFSMSLGRILVKFRFFCWIQYEKSIYIWWWFFEWIKKYESCNFGWHLRNGLSGRSQPKSETSVHFSTLLLTFIILHFNNCS